MGVKNERHESKGNMRNWKNAAKGKKYAKQIEICGEKRNSYSKTDTDATFMRVKKDYMGNDQLIPAYNVQLGICDEYIAVVDVEQYASDMDCFIPMMERFHAFYERYPLYAVGDAGYGSYNNYLFCEENGIEKYMKFPIYEKESKDKTYRSDPFRAVHFKRDKDGDLICPNGKKFLFVRRQPVKGNQYGRMEELYQCEDCEGCPYRSQCHKSQGQAACGGGWCSPARNLKAYLSISFNLWRHMQEVRRFFGLIQAICEIPMLALSSLSLSM